MKILTFSSLNVLEYKLREIMLIKYQTDSFGESNYKNEKTSKATKKSLVPLKVRHPGRMFKKMWESAHDAIVMSDNHGKVLYANPSYYNLCGYSPAGIVGKDITVIFPREVRKNALSQYKNVFHQKKITNPVLTAIQCADGTIRHVESRYSFLYNRRKKVAMIAILRDNTQQTLHEKKRDEHLSTARHEMKTPLATINAYVQMLEKRSKNDKTDKTAEYFFNIHKELTKLNHLINELLDAESYRVPKIDFKLEIFDFDKLVEKCVQEKQEMWHRHRIVLEGKTEKKVLADKEKIWQVCQNLIDNAVKYSPDANKILIKLEPKGENVKFSVVNSGFDIPENQYQKIFSRLYHNGRSFDDEAKPAVDFYNSKDIIHAHGGRIDIVNEIKKVSIFYFELPINILGADCFTKQSSEI